MSYQATALVNREEELSRQRQQQQNSPYDARARGYEQQQARAREIQQQGEAAQARAQQKPSPTTFWGIAPKFDVPLEAMNVQFHKKEMVGPLQPGQKRPSITELTYDLPKKGEKDRMVPDNQEALLGFGISTTVWNPKTRKQYVQQGSDVASAVADFQAGKTTESKYYAEKVPAGPGVQQDPFESRLAVGMLNFQVITAPILVPKLIPFAAGGVGVAEGVKRVTTGKDLTAEEAFAAAGVGELVGAGVIAGSAYVNSRFAKPRVTESITKDYIAQQRLNEDILSGRVAGETKMWSPSTVQRIQMRITGAQPKSLAPGISTFGSAQDAAYSMSMMEAESASFDFGFSPRSSFVGYNKGPTPPSPPAVSSKFPLSPVMLSWQDYKNSIRNDVKTAELNAEMRQRKIDQGIPESQLAYNYQGSLSFNNYPIKQEYAPGKFVSSAWRGPFQEPRGSNVGMGPLWNSVGSKAPSVGEPPKLASYGEGYSVVLKATQRASAPSFTQGAGRQGIEEMETQFLSYPKSGLSAPPILGTKFVTRQEPKVSPYQVSRVTPGFLNLQRSGLTPVSSFVVRQTQPQLVQQTPIQGSVFKISEKAITTVTVVPVTTQTAKTVMVTGWPSSTKMASSFADFGFKFEGPHMLSVGSRRRRGLYSKKQVYPILTAWEVLNF